MTNSTILAATWNDGVFVFSNETRHHELAGQAVGWLADDGCGSALAIVDRRSICRRQPVGKWNTVATSDLSLACLVAVEDVIYAGTDDARILRVGLNGQMDTLRGFDTVPGRDTWYAGSALINGQVVGPPLGIRSISATANGVLLANVHVGGIPRSADGGATWQPTIDIDSDVHEVCAHPVHPEIVVAAAAVGLCISRDGGATWTIQQEDLHASYCSAVAFTGNDILVSASTDPFAERAAIYRRRPIDAEFSPAPVGAGFPRWTAGIVDTGCIAARGSAVVVADRGGNLYFSTDDGRTWSHAVNGLPAVSNVLIV